MFAANPPQAAFAVALALPAAITLLFILKRLYLLRAVVGIARYVHSVESVMQLPTGLGWETHLLATGHDRWGYFNAIFWGVLLLGNIALAIAMWLAGGVITGR